MNIGLILMSRTSSSNPSGTEWKTSNTSIRPYGLYLIRPTAIYKAVGLYTKAYGYI